METLIPAVLDWGVAMMNAPGQSESGDVHAIKFFPGGALVGVVDGLGHGNEAAVAARIAARNLEQFAQEPVMSLLRRCHEELRPTRGAVMSIASFNAGDDTMTWLGIGNVRGILLRADPAANPPREFLLMRRGVVGDQFERAVASIVPIFPGDTLLLATDGVQSDLTLTFSPAEASQHLADRILRRYARGTDDALVLVARYRGCSR